MIKVVIFGCGFIYMWHLIKFKRTLSVVSFQHCDQEDSASCSSSMRITEAWKAGYRGNGVVVTILDDGIESSHPDLHANYVRIIYN